MRDNPDMTNLEMALRLKRTVYAVTTFRKRNNLHTPVNYYQQIYA
jgi:hypothetical protein